MGLALPAPSRVGNCAAGFTKIPFPFPFRFFFFFFFFFFRFGGWSPWVFFAFSSPLFFSCAPISHGSSRASSAALPGREEAPTR